MSGPVTIHLSFDREPDVYLDHRSPVTTDTPGPVELVSLPAAGVAVAAKGALPTPPVPAAAAAAEPELHVHESITYRTALLASLTMNLFVGWLICSEFFFSLWWHILDPTNLGVSYYAIGILFLALAIAPLAFTIGPITRLLTSQLHWVGVIQPIILLLALVQQVAFRTAVLGIGMFLFMSFFVGIFSLHSHDLRRQFFRYANPLGLLLMMVLRWDWSGAEATVVIELWYTKFVIAVLALIAAIFVLYDEMTTHPWIIFDAHAELVKQRRGAHDCCNACPQCADDFDCSVCCRPTCQWQWFFRGLEFGSIVFLSVWLFDNSAIICRWGLMDPYPNGLATIFMLLAGICLDFAYAHSNERDKVLTTPFAQFCFSGTLLIVGISLMAHTVSVSAFVGGLLVALSLPSLWHQVMHDIKLLRNTHSFGFALPIAGVVLCIYYFGTIAILAGGVSPFFGSTGGNPITWLWLPTGCIIFGPLLNYIRRLSHMSPNWQAAGAASSSSGAAAASPSESGVVPAAGAPAGPSDVDHAHPSVKSHVHINDVEFLEVLIVVGVIVLCVLVPGIIYRSQFRYVSDAPFQDRLRVTSFNVQQQHTLEGFTNAVALKDFIKEKGSGYVGFQEASALLLVNGNFDLADYLSTYLHADTYAGVEPYRAGAGCLALSHYKLYDNTGYVMPSLSGCEKCPLPNRMLVVSHIYVNRTRIAMFDTHVEFFSADAATLQVSYIAGLVKAEMDLGVPVIVMGDFNIPVDFPSLDPLFALGLKHTGMVWLNQPRNGTFHRTECVDDTHIDHIFYTPSNLDLIHYDVFDDNGAISDHLPVTADFKLRV